MCVKEMALNPTDEAVQQLKVNGATILLDLGQQISCSHAQLGLLEANYLGPGYVRGRASHAFGRLATDLSAVRPTRRTVDMHGLYCSDRVGFVRLLLALPKKVVQILTHTPVFCVSLTTHAHWLVYVVYFFIFQRCNLLVLGDELPVGGITNSTQ